MKTLLRSYATAIILLTAFAASAQDIDYTQYYLNNASYNPAFTGIEDFVDVRLGFRQGWNSFAIPNNYMFFSLNSGLNNKRRAAVGSNSLHVSDPEVLQQIQNGKKIRRKHGLGGTVASRKLGPYSVSAINAQYAYHLPVSQKFTLAFGSRVGFQTQRITLDGFTVRDEVNDLFYQEIMRSSQGNSQTAVVDFGYVVYSRKFSFGISSLNLVKNTVGGPKLLADTEQQTFLAQVSLHEVQLGQNLIFSPGARVAYIQNRDIAWNLNARISYKKLVYLGGAYASTGNRISGLLGLRLMEKLTLHYAFDRYMLNANNNFNTNVHEVVIGIAMFNKYEIKPKLW